MSTYRQPAHHTPTSLTAGTNAPSKISNASVQTSAAVALNMSWQLLVVIVLPIVGGRVLDTRYHTGHLWVIIGMVLGLVGTILVVRQAVQQLNEIMNHATKEQNK